MNYKNVAEEARKTFLYFNGVLFSRSDKNKKPLGFYDHKGYVMVYFMKRNWRAHRIIFLIHNNYLPKEVDHINRIKDDNRIENIRAATNGQNQANAPIRRDNTSGIKGVSWDYCSEMWRVRITTNGKVKYLGRFANKEEARDVIRKARIEAHGKFACHG